MEPIISVDTDRKKVLITINDTFQNDCDPTIELENVVAGTNKKILEQLNEKLKDYNYKIAEKPKWRFLVKAYGYAAVEAVIEKE